MRTKKCETVVVLRDELSESGMVEVRLVERIRVRGSH